MGGKCGTVPLALFLGLAAVASHPALAEGGPPNDGAAGGSPLCINGYSQPAERCIVRELPRIDSVDGNGPVCINCYSLTADSCATPKWRAWSD